MMITTNDSKHEKVYIHDVLCDYPGCMSYKTYSNNQEAKDFDVDPRLISDGWSVVKADDINYKMVYCPDHKEYVERISKRDRLVINAM